VEREDSGFLEMLCEVTGTAAFDDRLSKMLAALGEAALKKESLRQILSEIEMKLEGLSVDKETYSKIENIEIRKKAYSKALYVGKIAAYE
jgi:chromosome segregation ATPase